MTQPSTTVAPTTAGSGAAGGVPHQSPRRRPTPAAVAARLPAAVWALALFLTARLTGTLVLVLTARAMGKRPLAVLGRSWDSNWYLRIAAEGYGHSKQYPHILASDLAFFPLYPGLVRAVTEIVPLSGGAAGLLVSWTAAAVAACGIYAVGARLHDRATATALVLLWGLLPHSVILSLAYTEPVLTACAAWALYAVLTGRWLWAGTLAALAGLARPNGIAVAAAVLAAAAYEVWRRRGRKVPHSLWTGVALAPLGWGGFVLWVGVRQGDPLHGYFTVQRRWGSRFDFGVGALGFVRHLLLHHARFAYAMTTVIAAVALVLLALLLLDRAPLPLLVYSAVLLLIALGGDGFFASKPRFLLPAFPLLLPPAAALAGTARARPWHAAVVVGALAGLSYVYGAFLVVVNRTPL